MGKKKVKIEDFKGIKLTVDYEEVVEKFGDKTVEILKKPGVSPRSGRPNRTTPYADGWTHFSMKKENEYAVTVWNATNWQLTHLIEHGHFITNQKGAKITWVEPNEHIKPTYEKIKPEFIDSMVDVHLDAELI